MKFVMCIRDETLNHSFSILITSLKNTTQLKCKHTQQFVCELAEWDIMKSTSATVDVCSGRKIRRGSAKTARMRAQPYPSVNTKQERLFDRTNQFIADHQELITSKKISFYGAIFTSHNPSYQLVDMHYFNSNVVIYALKSAVNCISRCPAISTTRIVGK